MICQKYAPRPLFNRVIETRWEKMFLYLKDGRKTELMEGPNIN